MLRSVLIVFWLFALQISAIGQFGKSKTTRAVIVGISDYENLEIPDLQFAHRDAQAFYDYLLSPSGGNLKKENIQLLVNGEATGGNVHKALYWLIKEALPGDKSIIYFSGHGDVETIFHDEPGHLLVYDSPNTIYQINSLRIDDLKRIVFTLTQSKQSKVTIYTDACRSGKLAGSEVKGAQATAAALTSQFSDEVKIMSCQPNEFSIEGKQWGEGRGLFSYYLVKGLMGLADTDMDLAVSLKELQRYLEDRFDEELTDVRQTPVTVGDKNQLLSYVDEAALEEIKPPLYAMAAGGLKSPQSGAMTADSLLQKFYDALQADQLLEEEYSASFYFELIRKEESLKAKLPIVKGDLIAKLTDKANQAINQYLNSDYNELKRRYSLDNSGYNKYSNYLERASALLGDQHYLFPQLKAKAIYFSVVGKRLKPLKDHTTNDHYLSLISQLEEALKFESRAAFIYNELGLLNMNIKEYDRALDLWDKAIEISPQWALPYGNKSRVYNLKGEYNLAIEWANLAKDISPTITIPYVNLAIAYEKMGNLKEAIIQTQKALSINPTGCGWIKNLANYHYSLGQFPEALEYINQALDCNPEYLPALRTRPFILFRLSKHDQAVEESEKLLEKNPKDPIRLDLAMMLLELKRSEEAIKHFDYYSDHINPEYYWAYFDKACAYALMDDLKGFERSMKKAIEYGFNNKKEMEESPYLSSIRSSDIYLELLNSL